MNALAGIRVLELLADTAGSATAMHLAAAGATVLKVELPGGDPLREWEPRRPDGFAAAFAELNRGKRSIAQTAGETLETPWLASLIAGADVLIVSHPATSLESVTNLAAMHPRLVIAVTSPFGETGPMSGRPGSELAAQAMSDTFGSLGQIGEAPVRLGADASIVSTAIFTTQAIAAALIVRESTGAGQIVSTSNLGSLLAVRNVIWTALSNPDEWWGFHLDSWTRPPEHGYATSDGTIFFNLWRGDSEDWDRLLVELDLYETATSDPRFSEYGRQAAGTGRYAADLKSTWEAALSNRTSEEAIGLFKEAHANVVPVHDYESLFADPHFPHLGMLREVAGSATPVVALPWEEEGVPWMIPSLDEHGAAIRADGWSAA